jgi:hypothetical protein
MHGSEGGEGSPFPTPIINMISAPSIMEKDPSEIVIDLF